INTIGTLIGMIPSGLVALSSAVFCISVIRLAKHKTLAQDMYCVETLARVDVLCLDKTGTITEGTMEVNSISPKAGGDENEIKQILKNFTEALAENNATANAIGDYVKDCASNASTTEIVPFSSARKWSGAYLNGRSYVLGAPEFVFTALPKEITSVTETMAEKGFRVLVLASSPNHFEGSNIPDDLTLESFVFITDKIRAEAPDTLRFFREQGVNVKIISGDNPATVRAVALRAGLEDCDNFIDMSTLKTDEEV
ncbi:MAG: HAD-IC family P-type ATPase, partial [Clostridia bacterium]